MSLSNFQNLSNTRSVCRVTLERATSASIVPQAVIEQEAGGNVEMRDLQLRKNFGGEKDTENYTFRWQEKVYSDVSTAVSDLKIRSWSCRVSWKLKEPFEVLVVRSPFRAKHYVVVQYMAAGLKCPLSPSPLPPPPLWTVWVAEDKEDKEELMNKEELTTLPTPQGTSHCSCLEHCFLFFSLQREVNYLYKNPEDSVNVIQEKHNQETEIFR